MATAKLSILELMDMRVEKVVICISLILLSIRLKRLTRIWEGTAINVLYIKRLDDALKDGNPIQAIIRSTASNCDGKTFGLTQPSSQSHEELLRTAHAISGIQNVHETAFVECHGTGTPTGDPLETQAVARVFNEKGIYICSVRVPR